METSTLDSLIKEYRALHEEHTKAKAHATDLYRQMDEKKINLLNALRDIDKDKYQVKGLGQVSVVNKFSVPTPKSHQEKKEFFKFLKEYGGEDFFWTYASVNSRSLNSLVNDIKEENGADFEVPGIAAPVIRQQIRFKKE